MVRKSRMIYLGAIAVLFVLMGLAAGSVVRITAGILQQGQMHPLYPVLSTGNAADTLTCIIIIGIIVTAVVLMVFNRVLAKSAGEDLADRNKELVEQVNVMTEALEFLQDAYQMTEKTNKAKSKFMNRMSHDLRTPMNAIVGYSLLMEHAADEPEKVNYYAKKITLSSQTLMELINDVLDMSSIESGNVKLVESEFSLRSAIEEVNAAVRPQIRNKNQKFNFYMTNETDKDLIVGDKQRLCQILRNILSNAVKYTPDGGSVDLIVNVISTGGSDIHMLCQIKDNGCGMSEEFADRLFEPFEREENELNTRIPGTGLGMCIAKSFVELMNGNVTVESKRDTGTLVTIRIPLTPVAEKQCEISQMFDNAELLKGLKFLAAEDNESNAEILCEVLSALGAECVITKDGKEAVEVFEASEADEFDIVLLDIQMPVMNGYQAATAIRKCRHPRAKDVAIAAMTADAFEEDVQKAFVSGMNAHVAKPLDLQAFLNTVESLNIHRQKSGRLCS